MHRKQFEKVCRLAEHGEHHMVEHLITHETGRVLHCIGTYLEVNHEGVKEKWARPNCQDIEET
jgi:hypothetical protein